MLQTLQKSIFRLCWIVGKLIYAMAFVSRLSGMVYAEGVGLQLRQSLCSCVFALEV